MTPKQPIVNNDEESYMNGMKRGLEIAESEKVNAIRRVVERRVAIIDKAIAAGNPDSEWYKGRRTGLLDVYDLLGDPVELIEIELEEKPEK